MPCIDVNKLGDAELIAVCVGPLKLDGGVDKVFFVVKLKPELAFADPALRHGLSRMAINVFISRGIRQHHVGDIQHRPQAIHVPQVLVVADPYIPRRRLVRRIETLQSGDSIA